MNAGRSFNFKIYSSVVHCKVSHLHVKVAYEGSSFCGNIYTDYALSMDLSQITPAVVPELTKAELEELGVNLLGDQKRLRAACNPPATG